MSKEQKHIDDLFKDELKDMNLQASQADFDAIMQKMNPPKKKRPIFIWFIAGLAGLSLLTWGVTTNLVEEEIAVQESPIEEEEVSAQEELAVANTDARDETVNSNPKTAKANDMDVNTEASLSGLSKKSNAINNTKGVHAEGSKTNSTTTDNKKTESGSLDSGPSDEWFRKSSVDFSNKAVKQVAMVDVVPIEDLQPVEMDVLNTFDTSEVLKDTSKKLKKPIIPPVLAKPAIRLEFIGSYLLTNHVLSSSSDYAKIRENGESAKGNLNFGVRAYKELNNVSFGTGLEFHTYSQEASYRYERKAFDWIPVLNPMDDTIGYFRGNFRDTMEDFKSTNKVSSVRVPVTIGYNLRFGKNGLRFIGGLNAELITKKSGSLPGNTYLIPTSVEQEYSQDFQFGWTAEIGYFRAISSRLDFEIRSYYGASLSNFLGDVSNKDKPRQYGIGIGVSYNLGL